MANKWWSGPEYNGIKAIILIVVIALAGYFVYNTMHQNSLENAGRVATDTTGTTGGSGTTGGTSGRKPGGNPGTTGTGTTTGRGFCGDPGIAIALTTTLGGGPTPTSVTTATGGVTYPGVGISSATAPGQWLNFRLMNPGTCAVDVTKVTVELQTNDLTSWPPIQYVQLTHNPLVMGTVPTVAVGTTIVRPVVTATSTIAGTSTLVFSFPGTPVTIAPGAIEAFHVVSNSKNVSNTDPAGVVPLPIYFKLQLMEFLSTSAGTPTDQSVSTGTIPATIVTPRVNIY